MQLELFDVATHYTEETTEHFKDYGCGGKEFDYSDYMYQFHACLICEPYKPKLPLTDWSKQWQ